MSTAVCGGCKYALYFRDGDHPVHPFEPVQIGHDLSLLRIEDDQLICIHVSDIEAAILYVQALVVEPNGRTGHGDVRNLLENAASGLALGPLRMDEARAEKQKKTSRYANLLKSFRSIHRRSSSFRVSWFA